MRWRLEVGPVGLTFGPAGFEGLGCEDSTAGCWIGQAVCRVGPANSQQQSWLSHQEGAQLAMRGLGLGLGLDIIQFHL